MQMGGDKENIMGMGIKKSLPCHPVMDDTIRAYYEALHRRTQDFIQWGVHRRCIQEFSKRRLSQGVWGQKSHNGVQGQKRRSWE